MFSWPGHRRGSRESCHWFPDSAEANIRDTISIASGPLIRIIPLSAGPGGDAIAVIVSSSSIDIPGYGFPAQYFRKRSAPGGSPLNPPKLRKLVAADDRAPDRLRHACNQAQADCAPSQMVISLRYSIVSAGKLSGEPCVIPNMAPIPFDSRFLTARNLRRQLIFVRVAVGPDTDFRWFFAREKFCLNHGTDGQYSLLIKSEFSHVDS